MNNLSPLRVLASTLLCRNNRRSQRKREVRLGSMVGWCDELEARTVPASVAPGQYNNASFGGAITSAIEFDQPGLYEITGDLTVNGTGILTVGTVPGVELRLRNDVDISVTGSMAIDGASVTVTEDNGGGASGITVSGSLTAANAVFGFGTTGDRFDTTMVRVTSGGTMTASGTTFGWDVVAWERGSVEPSAVSGNDFARATVYAPPQYVPLLAGNANFGDVYLLSGAGIGADLHLGPLGTAGAAGQRYVIPSRDAFLGGSTASFDVGGKLTFDPGARVLLLNDANVVVSPGATLSLAGTTGSPVTVDVAEDNGGGASGITVSGSLTAANAVFGFGTTGDRFDTTMVRVTSGGTMTASGTTFGWDVVAWERGSVEPSAVSGNDFARATVYAPPQYVPLLAGNANFGDVYLLSGAGIGADLHLGPLGTAGAAGQRYVIPSRDAFLGGSTASFDVGGKLTFDPGARVLLLNDANVVVSPGATLSLAGTTGSPVTVDVAEDNGGGASGITVSGSLTAANAVFGFGTTGDRFDTTMVRVTSGGTMTASGTTFGWDVVAWERGSVEPSAVSGNDFARATVYAPPQYVPLLAGNANFGDVYLLSGAGIGADLHLGPLGTAGAAGQRYVIHGRTAYTGGSSATFDVGGKLTFQPGSRVLIDFGGSVDVRPGGVLAFSGTSATPVVVSVRESSGVNPGIAVSGSLSATNTAFGFDGTPSQFSTSFVRVASGGSLTASGSTFGWDVTAFDPGSNLAAGNVAGNDFAGRTVYAPPTYVPLLANNANFGDVYLLSGQTVGADLQLGPLGTAGAAGQRYVIHGRTAYTGGSSATFDVGGKLTFQPGSRVLIDFGGSVDVRPGGVLAFSGTSATPVVVSVRESSGVNPGIAVSGSLSATNTAFGFDGTPSQFSTSFVRVTGTGSLLVSGGNFGWDAMQLDAGSASTINYMLLNGRLRINNSAVVDLSFNDFSGSAIVEAVGSAGTQIFARNNFWGTTVANEIENLKLVDDTDNAALPQIVFSPVLSGRPVRPEGDPVPPVPHNPNATTSLNLSADLTTTVGTVTTGTVTFTIRLNGTIVGSPVTVNVSNGTAATTFALPAGSPGGNYVVQFVYSNGTDTFTGNNVVFTVTPIGQAITFTAPSPVTYSPGGTVSLVASSDSGLAITYVVVSGPATVSGSTLTITGAGTVVIEARQAGNSSYNPATPVQTSLVISPAPQTITFPALPPIDFAPGRTVSLAAFSDSGLAITYVVVSGPATVSGSTLTITGAGTVVVEARQSGNANFSAATTVQQSFVVSPASQAIAFTPPAGPFSFGAGPINLAATSDSGLTVTFVVVSGPATLSGDTLTITGAGTIVVRASQAGTANYNAATPVDVNIVVAQASTIADPDPNTVGFSAGPQTVTLRADITSSGPTVNEGSATFTVRTGGGSVVGSAVVGSVVNGVATVGYSLPAGLTAGTYTIEVAFGGTANFAASSTATSTLNVSAAPPTGTTTSGGSQTITFAPGQQSVTLAATVTSGAGTVSEGTVTFTIRNGVADVGTAVTVGVTGGSATAVYPLPAGLPAGTYTIRVVYNGTANFAGSTDATAGLTVSPAGQTITFPSLASRTFSAGLTVSLTATSSSGLAVSYVVVSGPGTVVGNTLSVTGAGTIVVRASQSGNANYTAAVPVDLSLVVNPAPQAIVFPALSPVTFAPNLTVPLAATSNSGLAVTYVVLSGPAVVSGNTLTVTGAGTVVVQAAQAGNANYLAAAAVQTSLTVTPAPQTIVFTAPPEQTFAPGLTISLSASGGASGNAVVFAVVSGPATVSGGVVTVTGPGEIVVRATQAGSAGFAAADPVLRTIVVLAAPAPVPPPAPIPVPVPVPVPPIPVPTPRVPSELRVGVSQIGVSSDASPVVNFFNPNGQLRSTTSPFPDQPVGVRVAAADFNRDGVADLVVGTGPGGPTRVRVLDGVTGAELFSLAPFEASFTGGVYVAAGDLNGDGVPELVITPDEGGGPRVRIFNGNGFGQMADFFGIDDSNFRGGARATVADFDGDGVGDLVVAAGFGGGPRIAVFGGPSVVSGRPSRLTGDFFAFEETLRNGAFVAAGDVDGDGLADLIAGGGPGGGPRVTVFSGAELLAGRQTPVVDFFAGNPDNRGGVRVAVKNLDGDDLADIVVGDGEGAGSRVTGYAGSRLGRGDSSQPILEYEGLPGLVGGVFVG